MSKEGLDIVLNAQALAEGYGGVREYVAKLARGLHGHDEIARLRFLVNRHLLEFEDIEPLLRREVVGQGSARILSTLKRAAPRRLREALSDYRARKVDLGGAILHEPNHLMTYRSPKSVLTVHDLSCVLYPEFHPKERVARFTRLFDESIRSTSLIITVSNTIQQQLLDSYPLNPERVRTIHLGIAQPCTPSKAALDRLNLRLALGDGDRFVLLVGSVEPRKNHLLAVQAFQKASLEGVTLVHAGPFGWKNRMILFKFGPLIATGKLVMLGPVSDEDLSILYREASLLIYPSIYEGFGLPPLEAQAHECRCITSDIPVHREIYGESVSYCSLGDVDGLAGQMTECLSDEGHVDRADSRHLVDLYSIEQMIDKTIRGYRSAGE